MIENKIKKLKNTGGYLLVESMVGISIAIVGILGILNVLSRSVSLNRTVGDQFIGNYLAIEGIEITKNLIDSNILRGNPWNLGFAGGSFEVDYSSKNLETDGKRPLLFDSAANRYGYESGNATPFTRTIVLTMDTSEEIKVNSIVQWTARGGGQFKVDLEDHFFNWR